jgi:hypothetical protein
METKEINNKISELAQKLQASNSQMTRSDLAWELKDFGINSDSPEISRLVWDCYQQTGDKAIAECFINNSHSNTIIEEYRIPALLDAGQNGDIFGHIDSRLKQSNDILSALSNLVDDDTKMKLIDTASSVIGTLSGTEAITRIQGEAQQVFAKYSQLADAYTNAKDSIRTLTGDFSELRQSTAETFRKYALALTDIFGDRIKATMPEMFDFDSIQFLDIDAMVKSVQLGYNSIYGKCGELAGEVSESFSKTISRSATQFGAQSDKTVGLIVAGLNMVAHYIKTGQYSASLRRDLAELRASIAHDVATIRTDEIRLVEIYKTLNDVFIPKAELFAKSAPQVFDEDFENLTNAIYSTPEARSMKVERDGILSKMRSLERRIYDAKMSLNYYKGHVSDSQQTLESLKEQYEKAKSTKPEPPSSIGNVFSLGNAKKNYNREIYEWSQNCQPLISTYESLIIDVKVDSDEIESQTKILEECTAEYEQLKRRQQQLSDSLSAIVTSSPKIRTRVAAHLDDIIKLLHLAKEISSSKLDQRLVETIKVSRYKDIELPENLSKALSEFKEKITNDIKFTTQDAHNITSKGTPQEVVDKIAADGNDALQKGIEICNQLAQLETMKLNYKLSEEHYNKEFEKIKGIFAENIAKLDNQAEIIREIARKINTAENNSELKKGLISLLDNQNAGFSDADWDDFIAGKKTIEI